MKTMAEKEYIEVEKILDDIGYPPKWIGYEPYPFEAHLLACSLIKIIRNLIKEQPTADVQEVRHAKWELIDECANEGVYCSNCHKKVYRAKYANQKVKSNYCPNCGAKMDKE